MSGTPSLGPEARARRILGALGRTGEECLNQYRLLDRVGEGGGGIVYRALDTKLNRPVAVKVLRDTGLANGPARERFLREARAAAAVSHPNIAGVHDVGEAAGRCFIVMEFVSGRPLSAILQESRTDFRDRIRLLTQAARGLGAAHKRGIVHRDVKPGNILVSDLGEVKVVDFGLARFPETTGRLTESGAMVGTPLYMAPEQIEGRSVTTRTDVYALGAILYEILAGRPPHGGGTLEELFETILRREPVPPRRMDRNVPRDLEVICLKSLAKDPGGRYATADEMADELERWLSGVSAKVRTAGRRRNVPVILTVAAAVLAGGITPWWVWKMPSNRELSRPHLDAGRRLMERATSMSKDPQADSRERLALVREAIGEFEHALLESPDAAEARLELARACELAGDDPRAIGELDRIIAAKPELAAPYLERARLKLTNLALRHRWVRKGYRRDIVQAIEADLMDFERLVHDPRERLNGSAMLAYVVEDYPRAVALLTDYIRIAPDDATALAFLGLALAELGRLDEAEEALLQALQRVPHAWRAHNARGTFLWRRGDRAGALVEFSQVIRFHPRPAIAYTNRGILLNLSGDRSGAIEDFDAAIRHDPSWANAYVGRASARRALGDRDGAKADLERALHLDPDVPEAHFNRGNLRGEQGDWKEAIADYDEALRLHDEFFEAFLHRANARFSSGDVEGAILDYTEAARINPDSHLILWGRANAYGSKGEFRKAAEDLERVLELAPSDWSRREQARLMLLEVKGKVPRK